MLRFIKGDIFTSNADALVNPVNTVGVMGKGLAKVFKQKYPQNFEYYNKNCKQGIFYPGSIYVCEVFDNPLKRRWIVNMATKDHWRNPSKYEYIELGLGSLRSYINNREICNFNTVAIPAIGCGEGGLEWRKVSAIILDVFFMSPFEIEIYQPD